MTGLFKDLKKKDSLLAQKAKFKWLREGDANTKFYHRVINKRRKRNDISGIIIDNVWREEVQEVKEGIYNFFKEHYTSRVVPRPSLRADFAAKTMSTVENAMLTAPFVEEEIYAANRMCESSKSPGPDGYNFGFFKEYWELF